MSSPLNRGDVGAADIDGSFVPVPGQTSRRSCSTARRSSWPKERRSAHFLDELATLVWNTFDGRASLDELAEDFADVFGAESTSSARTSSRSPREIGRAGLLVGVAYEPPPEPSFAWPTGVDVGEPIPPFRLPDAEGTGRALRPRRPEVLLVNWSPRCGFCIRIAPELAELQPELGRAAWSWCSSRSAMRGESAVAREHGLQPRVLLGEGWTGGVRRRRHAAAYLVDGEGRRIRAHDRRGQGAALGAFAAGRVGRLDARGAGARAWAYRSPCYRASNLAFGVRSTEADVGAYLDHALSGCAAMRRTRRSGTRSPARRRVGTAPISLRFGSELVVRAHSKAFAIETLLWHLNGATVKRADPFVVLHAGGVASTARASSSAGRRGPARQLSPLPWYMPGSVTSPTRRWP